MHKGVFDTDGENSYLKAQWRCQKHKEMGCNGGDVGINNGLVST